ncbi:hypothetical protein Pst134EA_008989 [Puccinia striiformis f. sp. tritici]|uniref:hypothetical protein n=1 Tax=Puccinia striiformis f. sp. tritici TaxID=168172 RepID=UPI002007565D|nr:hypothetical protein Pst134EA_008989 [Puccinia striiformis f. sp. tritici]KAH9468445.1 hypothetical protein Pst134EA_008989 [Puccinia striiformis f. sp. tritici]
MDDSVYESYLNLLRLISIRNTRIDEIDEYLIGRLAELPKPNEDEETETELIEAILNFPPDGHGVLSGYLPIRAYSLLTLFALMGDQYLVYAITSVGIDVSDFDWSSHFNLLSHEVKLVLRSIKSDQSLRRPLRIPGEVQRKFREIRENYRIQRELKRTREEELSIPAEIADPTPKTGIWIGAYFVEDYDLITDQQQNQQQTRSTLSHKSSSSTITRRSNNIHQNKRAKLASLTSLPTPRYTTTPSPPPPPTKSTTVDIPTDLVTQNQSFVFVLVENLPMEASLSSIIFFFQNGSDIYKSARTPAQKTDALNGKLSRFKSNSMKLNKGILKFNLTQTDLTILKKKCESDHQSGLVDDQTKSILVRFPRLSSSSDLPVWNKFINEFQDKKFLVCDLLCPPLKCSLI